jgi:hypothetical protein
MRFPLALAAASVVIATAAAVWAPRPADAGAGRACPPQRVTPSYAGSIRRALRAKQDLWGNRLIARPNGPTYGSVRRLLKPLLFARSKGKPLTTSGIYYLPFAQPLGVRGASAVALHVADGSEILTQTANGPSLKVFVGRYGQERFGSCLARLTPARLADGYLPILETQYVDADGTRYRQESFAVRGLGTGSLVSFVRLTAAARPGAGAVIRLVPRRPARRSTQRAGDPDGLVFSAGGTFDGSSVRYRVGAGRSLTIYAGWLLQPSGGRPEPIDEQTYDAARERLIDFWQARLGVEPIFDVPERVVVDAERSLLVQDLGLTWRYSVGNQYQEFSFAEALDAAEVMGEYGFGDVTRQILRTGLGRLAAVRSNWRMGEKLAATALYYRLTDDRAYLAETTPALKGLVKRLGRQITRPHGHGLLRPERFSSDVAAQVYGLHSQTAVWQGLRAIAGVWAETGQAFLARQTRALAARLALGLRAAVRRSERRLRDRSLFVPAALLADHKPFDALTASRPGSYWNLVVPYALSSGFFAPHGREANGILRYMLGHGSRLLGLVRAGAYSLYGQARYPRTGTDQVYGLNVARFLADNDKPDQLVLSLYGMLGAGMTPATFVSGEAASVAPLRGAAYRSMYLPPNTASNSAFLETLRLMLVHEARDADGTPVGLELAYSTPRPWLGVGKTIAIREAPTSFGPLSYELHASKGRIDGTVEVPSRRPPRTLRLRLRLPHGERIVAVRVGGRPRPFDRRTGTIDLTGLRGTLGLVAVVRRSGGNR